MSNVSISKFFESVVSFPCQFQQNTFQKCVSLYECEVLDDLVLQVLHPPTTENYLSLASCPLACTPACFHSQLHSHPRPCLLAHLLSYSLLLLLFFPVFTHSSNSYPFLSRQFCLYFYCLLPFNVQMLHLPSPKQPIKGF